MANVNIAPAINAEIGIHTLHSMLERLPDLMQRLTDAVKAAGYDLPDNPTIGDLVALSQTSSFLSTLLEEIVRMVFRSAQGS